MQSSAVLPVISTDGRLDSTNQMMDVLIIDDLKMIRNAYAKVGGFSCSKHRWQA